MSGPVQLIPPGLLGMLQLKNEGRSPRDFIESYQPIIECREWLMQTNWNESTDVAAATAAGITGVNVFPALISGANTWLYVHEFSAYSTAIAAGETLAGAVCFRRLTGGAVPNHFPGRQVPGLANTLNSICLASATGFFMPPNMQACMFVTQNTTAAAETFTANFRWVSLPI